MKRKPTILVFLMLLAFTGQLLGAPFLYCPQLGAMATDELGVDCLSMDMAAGTEEMADKDGHDEGLTHSDSAMTDCNLCLHCPVGTSPGRVSAGLLTAGEQTPVDETFTLPSRIDGLFRPPISV